MLRDRNRARVFRDYLIGKFCDLCILYPIGVDAARRCICMSLIENRIYANKSMVKLKMQSIDCFYSS